MGANFYCYFLEVINFFYFFLVSLANVGWRLFLYQFSTNLRDKQNFLPGHYLHTWSFFCFAFYGLAPREISSRWYERAKHGNFMNGAATKRTWASFKNTPCCHTILFIIFVIYSNEMRWWERLLEKAGTRCKNVKYFCFYWTPTGLVPAKVKKTWQVCFWRQLTIIYGRTRQAKYFTHRYA